MFSPGYGGGQAAPQGGSTQTGMAASMGQLGTPQQIPPGFNFQPPGGMQGTPGQLGLSLQSQPGFNLGQLGVPPQGFQPPGGTQSAGLASEGLMGLQPSQQYQQFLGQTYAPPQTPILQGQGQQTVPPPGYPQMPPGPMQQGPQGQQAMINQMTALQGQGQQTVPPSGYPQMPPSPMQQGPQGQQAMINQMTTLQGPGRQAVQQTFTRQPPPATQAPSIMRRLFQNSATARNAMGNILGTTIRPPGAM